MVLTLCFCHAHIADRAVEQYERQTLLVKLVDRRLIHPVPCSLEVPARHNLECIADVDDKRTGLVRHVVPLLIPTPDLQTRYRNREQECCESKVSVAVHTQPLRCFLCLLLYGAEECVAEVALAGGAVMRLNVVPEVVVGQFEDAREEGQEAAVDGLCKVVAELFNFVHEGLKTFGNAIDILPVRLVPVELLDAIWWSTVALY